MSRALAAVTVVMVFLGLSSAMPVSSSDTASLETLLDTAAKQGMNEQALEQSWLKVLPEMGGDGEASEPVIQGLNEEEAREQLFGILRNIVPILAGGARAEIQGLDKNQWRFKNYRHPRPSYYGRVVPLARGQEMSKEAREQFLPFLLAPHIIGAVKKLG